MGDRRVYNEGRSKRSPASCCFSHMAVLLGLCFASCSSDNPPAPACDGSLTLGVINVIDSECGNPIGSITASGSGGNEGYEYSINQGSFQSSGEFEDLIPGIYTLKVKDRNNCLSELDVRIKSEVLIADIRPIIMTNCAVPDCHDSSTDLPDFTNDDILKNTADFIKGRTGNRSMPPNTANTTLTDEEIQLIACWANDGAN